MVADTPSPRAYAHITAAAALVLLGATAAAALHNGFRPSTRAVVAVMLTVTLWGAFAPRITQLNLLPRMMLFVYALPFSALVGYLIWDDYLWVFTLRGYAIGQDHDVMAVLTLTGLVGLCGLVAALHTVAAFTGEHEPRERPRTTTHALGHGLFAALIVAGVGLSMLSAPPETVFQSAYGAREGNSTAASINFPAAFLLSYVVFVLLWIDVERERRRSSRRWKMLGLGVAVAYVVIVLQILRGDRESSGLIAAFAGLYLTAPYGTRLVPPRPVVRARIRRMLLPLLLLVAVFIALGKARETVGAVSEHLTVGQMLRLGFSQNTWTGVLWTNLGTAWQYQHDMLDYKLGKSYLNYLMSLPPGVISRAYGYVRPEESGQGVASEDPAGVSSGGLHVVIVPFKNFGAYGALVVLFIYGTLIGLAERGNRRHTPLSRFLWGSTFCASFIWFWYGDMPIIRAVMAALLFYPVYRLAMSSRYVFGKTRAIARAELVQ